jgi:aspartyl-tRNA(Asn)/glutamyl-tRNA(Gln) amidotransferase subunit A
MKIALPTEFLTDALDPAIREKLDESIEHLRANDIQVEEVSIPLLSYVVPMYYTIMSAEVSTNLSRFDGIRFGHQDDTMNYDSIQEYYTAIRSQGFGDEAKRRILLGTYVLSSANYE